jgi:hypothetical protein
VSLISSSGRVLSSRTCRIAARKESRRSHSETGRLDGTPADSAASCAGSPATGALIANACFRGIRLQVTSMRVGMLAYFSPKKYRMAHLLLNASEVEACISIRDTDQVGRVEMGIYGKSAFQWIKGPAHPGIETSVLPTGVPRIAIYDAETHQATPLPGKDGRPLFPLSQE